MTISTVKDLINSSIQVKTQLLNDDRLMSQILDVASKCIESLSNGGKIIFCGNGGSFADAQHLSAEFTSRFLFDRPGLASIALGTNSSAMTAIGNDYGYDNVFSREIDAIANSSDILIAFTTSGNSSNILKALNAAKIKKVFTVVLTGSGKGKLADDGITINVPSKDTARIQECHILIGHIICELVESDIFKDLAPSS
jgi:D-sedoheptulose 7-phosphate isomerase|tara:strand:+ start:273 stop:866 length:594 start_codon:yes stop_codon:yes gene_type:complete